MGRTIAPCMLLELPLLAFDHAYGSLLVALCIQQPRAQARHVVDLPAGRLLLLQAIIAPGIAVSLCSMLRPRILAASGRPPFLQRQV